MFFSVCHPRVRAGLDGVLLGGQAEGVAAHRVQDALAAHPREAADDVGRRVALGMADVQPVAAGVGEHVEHVELLAASRRHVRRPERLVLVPIALPLGLDRGGVVAGHCGKGTGDRERGTGVRLYGEGQKPQTRETGVDRRSSPANGRNRPQNASSRPTAARLPGPESDFASVAASVPGNCSMSCSRRRTIRFLARSVFGGNVFLIDSKRLRRIDLLLDLLIGRQFLLSGSNLGRQVVAGKRGGQLAISLIGLPRIARLAALAGPLGCRLQLVLHEGVDAHRRLLDLFVPGRQSLLHHRRRRGVLAHLHQPPRRLERERESSWDRSSRSHPPRPSAPSSRIRSSCPSSSGRWEE